MHMEWSHSWFGKATWEKREELQRAEADYRAASSADLGDIEGCCFGSEYSLHNQCVLGLCGCGGQWHYAWLQNGIWHADTPLPKPSCYWCQGVCVVVAEEFLVTWVWNQVCMIILSFFPFTPLLTFWLCSRDSLQGHWCVPFQRALGCSRLQSEFKGLNWFICSAHYAKIQCALISSVMEHCVQTCQLIKLGNIILFIFTHPVNHGVFKWDLITSSLYHKPSLLMKMARKKKE